MPKYIYSILIISNLFSQVDYSTQIQPIFDNNCISCHIDGGTYSGGLDLSSYSLVMEGGSSGNTIVPLHHSSSELFHRITLAESDNEFMPQNGSPLSQSDIDLIAQWIDEGALETPNTTFQPQSTQELETAVDLWISDNTSALSLYGDINSWDVSNVTRIYYMFKEASDFNQDISSWDISNTSDLMEMFYRATNFNQDISDWDISNVTNMSYMFHETYNNLSNENKCLIHTAFNSNSAWNYDWSESCEMSVSISSSIPNDFIIHQNYPNPFNPTTTLRYDIPKDGLVNITVYDMLGNKINQLVNEVQNSGYKSVQWNATNYQGQPVSAGVYLYSIEARDFRQTKKMILLK